MQIRNRLTAILLGMLLAVPMYVGMSYAAETINRNFSTTATGNVTGQSSSVDSEIAIFSGVTGKVVKRATGTGLVLATAGVYGNLAITDDTIPIANGTTHVASAVPNCTDTGGNHLNYTTATNAISCGTSSGAAATSDTFVAKSANLTRSSTSTLASDPDLVFTNLAAGSYSFDAVFYVTNATATPSWKYGFLAGSAPTNSIVMCLAPGISSQAQNNWLTSPIAGNFAIPNASIGVYCSGTVVLAGTVTLTFQWAQQTLDASNTTLNAGSYMHVHKTL